MENVFLARWPQVSLVGWVASTCGQCWFGQGSVVGIVFEISSVDLVFLGSVGIVGRLILFYLWALANLLLCLGG